LLLDFFPVECADSDAGDRAICPRDRPPVTEAETVAQIVALSQRFSRGFWEPLPRDIALRSRPHPGRSGFLQFRRIDAIAPHRPRYNSAVATPFDLSIRVCAIALLLLLVGACAHTQSYQLDCVPRDVTIYLDKVPLDRIPDTLDLRTDQPHVLFFRGEGYEPTMVVLDTEETADGPALSPRDLCLELNIKKRTRGLEIEVED